MTNREQLEEAQIIKPDATFSPEQEQAIESLTHQEIEALISAKNKLAEKFPAEGLVAPPIQHHH